MENSLGSAFMAVFAVSGSVVLLAMKVHQHLLSNFINKLELQIGNFSNCSILSYVIV